jgi:hypothetical protein
MSLPELYRTLSAITCIDPANFIALAALIGGGANDWS